MYPRRRVGAWTIAAREVGDGHGRRVDRDGWVTDDDVCAQSEHFSSGGHIMRV